MVNLKVYIEIDHAEKILKKKRIYEKELFSSFTIF